MARYNGNLNRRTIEAREMDARVAARTVHDAQENGHKLAKEVLDIFMHQFANLAALYQRGNDEKPRKGWNEEKFKLWAKEAVATAAMLAPYQSPTFKAIAVTNIVADGLDPNGISPDDPVHYPSVAEIRAQMRQRGIPNLREIVEAELQEKDG